MAVAHHVACAPRRSMARRFASAKVSFKLASSWAIDLSFCASARPRRDGANASDSQSARVAQPDEVGKAPRRGTIKTFCSDRCGAARESFSPSGRFWSPIDHGPVHVLRASLSLARGATGCRSLYAASTGLERRSRPAGERRWRARQRSSQPPRGSLTMRSAMRRWRGARYDGCWTRSMDTRTHSPGDSPGPRDALPLPVPPTRGDRTRDGAAARLLNRYTLVDAPRAVRARRLSAR